MNIFKVLASAPRSKFQENQVSAFLAYLLNPFMDHGLGFEFLIRFLKKIEFENDITKKLKPNMANNNNDIDIEISLEYEVFGNDKDYAIIDILLKIEDHYISIENKIYSSSAADKEQLKKQYQCLQYNAKELKPKSVTMVFIVPYEENKSTKNVFGNLTVANTDKTKMISWVRISEVIQEILEMERNCEISPIEEYSRNTLKAFSKFIKDEFKGYIYRESKSYNRKTIKEIMADETIKYIGVQNGKTGLEKIERKELADIDFQYTNDIKSNYQWIKREEFVDIVNKIKNGES